MWDKTCAIRHLMRDIVIMPEGIYEGEVRDYTHAQRRLCKNHKGLPMPEGIFTRIKWTTHARRQNCATTHAVKAESQGHTRAIEAESQGHTRAMKAS